MLLKLCLCLAIITLCFACQPDKPIKEKSVVNTQIDSVMTSYVKATFNISDKEWEMRFQNFDRKYPDYRRYAKEIILHPDGQSFRPFVVKISTLVDSTITHFAFGDERYYASNSVSGSLINGKLKIDSSVETDTSLRSLLNLEKNLNYLIVKLNIQHDYNAVYSLLDIVFDNLLRMKPVDYTEADDYVTRLKKANKNGSANAIIKEYMRLREKADGKTFCLHAKDGLYGYWIFEINEENRSYHVKPIFIGDQFYIQPYW